MTVIHTLSTDLVRRGVTPRVYAMQFDGNTRVVELTLTALGEPWAPPAEAALALSYRKEDGTRGFYNQLADGTGAIDVQENRVSVTLAPQVLTAPGIVEAALVMEAGGQRVAAFPFEIHVAEDPSGGKEESDDYFNIQGGSAEALLYTAQTLTEAQQTQARANIGAADAEVVAQIAEKTSGVLEIDSINLISPDMASPKGEWWFQGVKYTSGNATTDASCTFRVPVAPNTTYFTMAYNADDLTACINKIVYASWFDANDGFIAQADSNYLNTITSPANASYARLTYQMYRTAADLEIAYLPYFSQESHPATYPPMGFTPITFQSLQGQIDALKAGRQGPLLHLPKAYSLVVGDTFELFYKGVMLCKDPYRYNILVACDAGKAYSRKFVFTPTAPGTHILKIQVTDDLGNIIDTQSTQLVVSEKMASPGSNIHVLCLGDSLTAGGVWVDELYRRLTKTSAVTQYNAAAPTGDGLGNISFVGKKTTQNGAGYEGLGGWTYGDYCNAAKAGNPFVYNGKVDFDAYCADLGISKIDRCHILLGWNMAGTAEASWKADAKALMDLLIAHNPAMEILLIGLQIPALDGLGENYGAKGIYADYRGLQEYVFRVDQWNNALAAAYPGNVSTVSIAGQFDTEHNMPGANVPVNLRNTAQVKQQNNGVHPDIPGYYQIADAVYRQFHRG